MTGREIKNFRQIFELVFDAVNACIRVCVTTVTAIVSVIPDTTGNTLHDQGSVGTLFSDIPAVPGTVITFVIIRNAESVPGRDMDFSLDGGTTFDTLDPGDSIGIVPKGDKTQIKLRKNSGSPVSVDYRVTMNRKA